MRGGEPLAAAVNSQALLTAGPDLKQESQEQQQQQQQQAPRPAAAPDAAAAEAGAATAAKAAAPAPAAAAARLRLVGVTDEGDGYHRMNVTIPNPEGCSEAWMMRFPTQASEWL